MSDKGNDLGNKPLIVILGLIASLIAIFTFLTGKQTIADILNSDNSSSLPVSNPLSPYEIIPSETPIKSDTSNVRATATQIPLPTSTEITIPPTIYNKRIRSKDGAIQVYVPVEMGFGGYWIDQMEISGNQFQLCVNDGSCNGINIEIRGDYPVELTGDRVQDYCTWAGVRMPTRDEWLRAATGTDGRTWPWGDVWDSKKANIVLGYNSKGIMPVGSYPNGASPYGVLDMAGSLTEWVLDSTCNDGFRLQGQAPYDHFSPEDYLGYAPSVSECLYRGNGGGGGRCSKILRNNRLTKRG